MKALNVLPENYKEIFSVDLQKDKKLALVINLLAVAIAVIMVVPMNYHISFLTLFDMSGGLLSYAIRFITLLVSIVAYMLLHEAVHGITMKALGTKKVKYGFTGLYAFAGSDDYYDKRGYITIALAPVIVWGAVLAVVNALVPESWFWVVYFIQISNISGAGGDFYVTARFSRMPSDILIRDSGVGMTVYSAK